jgi:hypothetical protein
LGALAFVAASWSEGLLAAELPHPYELIQQAGNAHDELDRLRLLRQVAARTDLDPALRADLDKVLPVVERWANGKAHPVADTNRAAENGYLCHFINSRVRPAAEGPVHPPEPAADSPLHPLWSFYRGRMLIWRVIQSGPLLRVKERREAYFNEGRRLLEEARRAFPENRVIRMYLGEPIPWPEPLQESADVSKRPLTQPISPAGGEGGRRPGEGDAQQHSKLSSSGRSDFADPQAPDWANLQREGLEKLADIIHWWIAERQLPDGQFGGGWGDDVEMCRWWTPVLIGFEDPVVNAAQERLSSGIFRQPHLKAGFTSRLTDVEHSNEDTTDTILPMMHLRPDDPLWKQRALRLAELMRQRWTGTNQHGFLQFRSIYFSVDRVDASPDRAFDTVYHPAVVQPALLYWQRTADPALTALFGQWLRLWVDATARGGNGKPAGVLPSAVRWPDGAIGLPGRPWWEPFSPGHNDALYNWPGACRLMTSTLLLAWYITGDESYLQPIRSMAEIRLRHLRNTDPAPPGSEAWAARQVGGFLADTLAKYRFLTGDRQYDTLLRQDASGYVRFRLTGQEKPLVEQLRRNAEAFRWNWEAYTSEMRWTDRVMAFTRNYLAYLPERPPPAPAPEILYSTVTGDPGNPLVFPLNAVRWRTPPRQLAARVTESSRSAFAAELFHFGPQPRKLEAELFLLPAGDYELTVTAAGRPGALETRKVRLGDPPRRVAFELPARQLCTVRLEAIGSK